MKISIIVVAISTALLQLQNPPEEYKKPLQCDTSSCEKIATCILDMQKKIMKLDPNEQESVSSDFLQEIKGPFTAKQCELTELFDNDRDEL